MKPCYIDFEYYNSTEEKLQVVCAVTKFKGEPATKWWLWERPDAFIKYIDSLKNTYFVAYAAEAESSALISLGIDPIRFKWWDLYIEYRMLLNHNDELEYGKQLIKGKATRTFPPPRNRWEQAEESESHSRPEYSLGAATYKFLDKLIDTAHKKQMRDRILLGGPYSDEEKKTILDYCASDVENLPELQTRMFDYLRKKLQANGSFIPQTEIQKIFLRGEYAARTAKMVRLGYPVNIQAINNLADNTPILLNGLCRDINSRLHMGFDVFWWDKREQKFKRNDKLIREHIEQQYGEDWPGRTEKKGEVQLTEEVLEKVSGAKHNYKDTLVDQLLRYTKTQASLKGFKKEADAGRKSFFDYVGSDGRVRPYFGIYGAQSSRSQPASTGYVMLKTAWVRSVIQPPKGRMIVGRDWSSVEILIAGIVAGDKRLVSDYDSGDFYLSFAKRAGAVPPDGKREDHEPIRDAFKSTTLGIQFLMGAKSLARKITTDTGTLTSETQAQELIDAFYHSYPQLKEYQDSLIFNYQDARGDYVVELPCGWRMFGDNRNFRSVANCPIQGTCASLMRAAVAEAQDDGLDVTMTLHDALYIECDLGDWDAAKDLAAAMDRACMKILKRGCRGDMNAWGTGLDTTKLDIGDGYVVDTAPIYVDKRAKAEYKMFSEYFEEMVAI